MRIACLTLAVSLSCLWPASARSGERYLDCAIPGGEYSLEQGDTKPELFEGEKKLDYEPVRKITVRDREGLCTTKSGEKFEWTSHSYLFEVNAVIDDVPTPLMFLCEEGGSGIPATVEDCTETTTKDKRLQPTYTEGPK